MTDYEAYLKRMEEEQAEHRRRVEDLWRQHDRNLRRLAFACVLIAGVVGAAAVLAYRLNR